MEDVLLFVQLEAILLLKKPAFNVEMDIFGMEPNVESCVLMVNISTLQLMNVNVQLDCFGLEKFACLALVVNSLITLQKHVSALLEPDGMDFLVRNKNNVKMEGNGMFSLLPVNVLLVPHVMELSASNLRFASRSNSFDVTTLSTEIVVAQLPANFVA